MTKILSEEFLTGEVHSFTVSHSSFSVNFAFKKPTSQSNNDGDRKSQGLVDGDTNGNFMSGSCTEVVEETDPWFRVDLRQMISVRSVSM